MLEYIRNKSVDPELSIEVIILLHNMLMGNINDAIAGRFRKKGEYVRVGTHIVPAPEHMERMIESIISDYSAIIPLISPIRLPDFIWILKLSIHFATETAEWGVLSLIISLRALNFPT